MSKEEIYMEQRIEEQRTWYAKKSVFNKRLGRAWAVAILIFYILSLTMTALLAEDLVQAASLPTELITTIISALIGWVQIKKYNELSASYALTAHEIGLVKEQSYYISGEKDFLDFIRDAETAFSREHTQWQARRVA
ncbi:SLATT domain-containing protein [Enterobacter hormaechei]|uniref:SLATT domain-containing protein n=1 Tax=Enterobacter hormaechei TaxID=158836 RepID=UPI003A9758C1